MTTIVFVEPGSLPNDFFWYVYGFVALYGTYTIGIITLLIAFFLTRSRFRKGQRSIDTPTKLLVVVGIIALLIGPIIGYQHSKGFSAQQRQKVATIKVQLYTYKQPGKILLRNVSNLHKPDSIVSTSLPVQYQDDAFSHLVERYQTKDSLLLEVRQFDNSKYPGGSDQCWPSDPEFPDRKAIDLTCQKIGTSNLGNPIYAAGGFSFSGTNPNYFALFTTTGSTRISTYPATPSTIADEAMLSILHSLKPVAVKNIHFVSQ